MNIYQKIVKFYQTVCVDKKIIGKSYFGRDIYAVKIGEAINPNDTLYDEAGAAVSVFKGLELVLNNKGESNTIPKMLHLANDFLLRAVKPSLAKKEHKQVAVGLSLLVDLAIDFFSAK